MSKPQEEHPAAYTFAEISKGENEFLSARRNAHAIPGNPEETLVGLALSGGGIRSATFNLGILQGLARCGFLKSLDYLSTVSGGGYIGSWLVAWLHREKYDNVEGLLGSGTMAPPTASDKKRFIEPDEIHFLRKYTSYLTPRAGAVSTDTWTLPAIYLRNVLLNLTLLVAVFGALTSVALFWVRLCRVSPADLHLDPWVFAFPAVLLAIGGVASMAVGMECTSDETGDRCLSALSAVFLFLSAVLGSYWLITARGSIPLGWLQTSRIYLFAWLLGMGVTWVRRHQAATKSQEAGWKAIVSILVSSFLAGAGGGGLLHGILLWFRRSHDLLGEDFFSAQKAVFGVAALVLVFLLTGVLHIGLAGRALPDDRREWLGRLGAMLMLWTLVWTGSFAIVVYGPALVDFLRHSDWAVQTRGQLLKWAIGGGWISATLAGILTGRMASSNGNEANLWTRWVARIAPVVFAAGFLVLVSYGVDFVVREISSVPESPTKVASATPEPSFKPASPEVAVAGTSIHIQGCVQSEPCEKAEGIGFQSLLDEHLGTFRRTRGWAVCLVLLACLVAMLLLSVRLDINEFSMHWFYRNRLARCYLGASVKDRHPNPFTGFSPDDDLPLCAVTEKDKCPSISRIATEDYKGPYPILCAALNLVDGKELAWQRRKAASFIFTPKYCGYDAYSPDQPQQGAYRPTHEFMGGASLGSAVAISGAAASPNMGYHTSAGLAFLMTVFDVRLGWWAGNPRQGDSWREPGPRSALVPLMKELFGRTDDESSWVYLSDGGHFENLGIYELARRWCKYIIVCDASQDADLSFDDLGNAIEKCRRDLGVEIAIDVSSIRREKKTEDSGFGWSGLHYAIGDIQYPRGAPVGAKLLYIKSSMTGDEPEDVLSYHTQHPVFPHDSTADQFFDETQFESYRRLGEHIFRRLWEIAEDRGLAKTSSFDSFLDVLQEYAQERTEPLPPNPPG